MRRAPMSTALTGAVALVLLLLASGCGAVVNDEAERARLDADRAVLQQRIIELEAELTAVPSAPTPTLGERLVLRQFVHDPSPPAGSTLTIELCVQIFGRGDPLAGIPPALTTSCLPFTVPVRASDDTDAGSAIDALVGDPAFTCWAAAAPGVTLPTCWP